MCGGQPRTRPRQPCPQPFLILDPLGASESLVFLGSPHRLFLPRPTLWRVCSAHSPPRPTHCRPCQDGTCPCTDMPLGTKLWTSQEGPAHVPPLLAVTLPQTTHPCPHDCPRHSCQSFGPGATLPSVRGDSLLASPHTLCPQWPEARAFCSTPLAALCGGWALPHRAWRQASRCLLMVPTLVLFSVKMGILVIDS